MKSFQLQLIALLLTLTWSGAAKSAPPVWATRDTQKLTKDTYEVVCSGTGPDINTARGNATIQCDISAIKQLKIITNVKSITIETETDASLHSEVSSDAVVKNLQCNPINESVDYGQDNATVYLKCRYNLLKAASDQMALPDDNIKRTFSDGSTTKSVLISSMPACTSILVRGGKARAIRCESNPAAFTIYPTDTEIIVRADKYKPKTISAIELLTSKGAFNVFLDQ